MESKGYFYIDAMHRYFLRNREVAPFVEWAKKNKVPQDILNYFVETYGEKYGLNKELFNDA